MIANLVSRVAAAVALSLTAAFAHAAPSTPEDVVRAYADAANRHDVDAVLALYAEGVHKYPVPRDAEPRRGASPTARSTSGTSRRTPDLNVRILDMKVLADKVVSHDLVTGLAGGKTSEELVVYQVDGEHISNIVYVERQLR